MSHGGDVLAGATAGESRPRKILDISGGSFAKNQDPTFIPQITFILLF
jgi:hypothetical protein